MDNYDDIINLPRHESSTRPRMPAANRAAQFSSFAALSGFGSAIDETARIVGARVELEEADIAILNRKLQMLTDLIAERPEVAVTYFQPDMKKDGGAYITAQGTLRRILNVEKELIFVDGRKIMIADVLDIECELFKEFA